jgi:hypothetical protein
MLLPSSSWWLVNVYVNRALTLLAPRRWAWLLLCLLLLLRLGL